MEHNYNSHQQVNHRNIHKHSGDFLLTHEVMWITEEEFHRNKTTTNSIITISSSHSAVVWDDGLLESYNNSFGLPSTITLDEAVMDCDKSEHRVSLFNNILPGGAYEEHGNVYPWFLEEVSHHRACHLLKC